jgi:predicted DsbA family dithiol-disulfide isomerase
MSGDSLLNAVSCNQYGLPAEGARAVLTERRLKDAVDADWARSREWGVTGVPTFVVGRYGVVGAQPYQVLEQLLEKAGARRRS